VSCVAKLALFAFNCNWKVGSREVSVTFSITLHAAPLRTEMVHLLFGQLSPGELHFYLVNGALRDRGHNRPIINLLSYRNVAGEQVATHRVLRYSIQIHQGGGSGTIGLREESTEARIS